MQIYQKIIGENLKVMKKIIQSDLVSIAHRILKLKDTSDVSTLLKETELLHKKLILLQFYDENKYRLDIALNEEKLIEVIENPQKQEAESIFLSADQTDDVVSFEEELITPIELNVTTADQIDEAIADEPTIDEEIEFTPSIEETQKTIEQVEEELEEIVLKKPFEDAQEAVERATLDIDPVFSIPHHELFNEENEGSDAKFKSPQHFVSTQTKHSENKENYQQVPLNKTINDAFTSTISVTLNDRIAFEKNLFNGNSDDLNRVISQLNTIGTYQEAKEFIENLVKPDFNNWKGKEEFETRFMELVEKRFH